MIFKNTKFLFSSLILGASILTFSLPKISVNAGPGNFRNISYRIVTHPNGINLRDQNCNIIGQAGYGEKLISSTTYNEQIASIGCNVNGGKNMEMVNYGAYRTYVNGGEMAIKNIFVSTRYTRLVNSGNIGTYTAQDKVSLNNPGGVNLRNNNCQRIMTLPNGTYSEIYDQRKLDSMRGTNGTNGNICQAGGEFYLMFPFVHKGEIYQVAEVLTKFE